MLGNNFFTVLSQVEANFSTREDDANFLYDNINYRQYQLQTQQPQLIAHDEQKNALPQFLRLHRLLEVYLHNMQGSHLS